MKKVAFVLPTKKIELPSFPGSEVTVVPVTVEQQRIVQKKYKLKAGADGKLSQDTDESIDFTLEILVFAIKSRNFTDGDGKDLEITKEAVEQMPQQDMNTLLRHGLGIKAPGFEKND